MGLFNLLRRPPPIRDCDGLADFIDQQAAFIIQKGIYEYSRARAGHYAKVLMAEQSFLEAVDHSRWQAYPLGLAMIAELVEGVLRPRLGSQAREGRDRLSAITLSVFDRYPVPATLGAARWSEIRLELKQRLDGIGLHAPKSAKDIPEPFADAYFGLMPIHEKLRSRDRPTTRNYLKVTMCNIHEELTQRMDGPTVIAALSAGQPA